MHAREQNGKSLVDAREMFHARILSSCQGERGRGRSCQSCDMAFVFSYQSLKESGQKDWSLLRVNVLNEDKRTLEYSIDSAEQMTGALTEI